MSMQNKLYAGALLALLVGCSSIATTDKQIKSTEAGIAEATSQQAELRKTGAVVHLKSSKLAGDEIAIKESAQLPDWFSKPFAYFSSNETLPDILDEIGRRTGVAVSVQASQPSSQTGSASASALFPGGQLANADTLPIDWTGDLKGLLHHIASRTKNHWKYEDGRIYFFKTETRVFNVYLPAGKRTIRSSISLSSGGSGGGASGGSESGGAGTVDVASDMEVDAYAAILSSIKAIVADGKSSGGAKSSDQNNDVVANPSLGLITVTSSPIILDRVDSHLRGINERFAQNVMIGVKIYNLTLKKGINAGVSLSLAYQDVTKKYGVNLAGAPNLTPTNGTAGRLIIDALPGSMAAGTSLVLQALEQVGDVALVTSGQVIAANGQPSPLQVANDVTYLASSMTSQTANVGTTTTLTPGSKKIGFTANFLPLILGDNRIMLQYQINLSSLLSLDQITSGTSMIQTPNISTQSLQQQAFLRDGQSIVLFGFEQGRASSDSAVGLTGISKNSGSEKNMMVIVLEVFSGK